ncbi:serpin family protein [Pseudarthrobacter sp. N5]|uniref:serpin family protein n=1 Tax=Pseudarthrobacter sp. N5 TaxID=3418416 RepID=UPI003CF19D83
MKSQSRFKAAVAIGAVAALTACSSPAPGLVKADGVQRVSVDRAAYAGELSAIRTSALKLGEALLADNGNGNVISSPGSLLIALAMLRTGASGETAVEMDSVLGLPARDRDEAMNALLASLEKYDGDPGSVDENNPPRKPVMHAANGLFVDKNETTGAGYLETLAKHYGTGVYPVDFRDEGATKPSIDAWVDKNTGGRIKEAPAQYSPDNTFSLLNAVYFASAWRAPFDPNSTADRPFTKANGEEISVPTMQNELKMAYADGAGWRAVDLPYADGFVMRLILPDAGAGTSGDSARPGGAELGEIANALESAQPVPVEIHLPKWDHKSNVDLIPILNKMGLSKTLGPSAEFDAIQPGLKITDAAQAANITVAEKGTIAAAVTQFNGAVSGKPIPLQVQKISFDRPFHYQIVHVESGLPLFMGKIADPRS